MRKNNESLSERDKNRILGFNYRISPYDYPQFAQALSAVPPDESWATYQWLDDQESAGASDPNYRQLRHDYIHASILEVSGKKPEALSQYKELRAKLTKSDNSTLVGEIDNAIKRLNTN